MCLGGGSPSTPQATPTPVQKQAQEAPRRISDDVLEKRGRKKSDKQRASAAANQANQGGTGPLATTAASLMEWNQ